VTYKGPKIDKTTKTRVEIELPLPSGDEQVSGWNRLLEVLGFARVAEVRKTRRKASISWEGRQIEAALDDVSSVGKFIELELAADVEDVEPAKACIASLAAELGLTESQTKSYLELFLERGSGA
jgi:adenylate cyclase class 2